MKTQKQSITIISQLFIQKWKKQREARRDFLLTPQECVTKFRIYTIKEITSVIFLMITVGLLLAILLNQVVLHGSGTKSIISSILALSFASMFCLLKPAKLGILTMQMYFDWQEVTRGLRRHNMLLENVLSKAYFAQQIEDKLRDIVRAIEEAQGCEEFRKKAKLKKKLSNFYWILSKLDLELPVYDDLFTGDFTVRCTTPTYHTTLRVIPKSA